MRRVFARSQGMMVHFHLPLFLRRKTNPQAPAIPGFLCSGFWGILRIKGQRDINPGGSNFRMIHAGRVDMFVRSSRV